MDFNHQLLKKLFLPILFLTVAFAFSQSAKNKTVNVKFTNETITADGVLDELSWQQVEPATNFWQHFPTDSLQAKMQSEIKFMFDDNNLYVGIKVNTPSDKFIIPSLRRDFISTGSDNITLLFDTFNDATNAYLFGSNPAGVQREMLLSGGGRDIRDFNIAWDTKWVCEATIHEDHYILEWIIPLSAFKYTEGTTKWRFNSYHNDTQVNETTVWINVPQNQYYFGLGYMGDMIFEKPLGKSKSPISIIPYINGLVGKDYENDDSTSDFKFGGDAKVAVSNSMNLDLTVNPDFSQVEVDQQVTNLTRFEVSLPERRQFFIDNSDLFADFGDNRDSNPFFSRRIGIASDINGNSIENDIIAGARLNGKLNDNLRLGVLNMQTAEDIANEIPTTNNAVITAQHKVFNRSNIAVMFINKQATKDYDFLAKEDEYNRVIGIDYRLATADNTWSGNYFFHKSFSPGVSSKDYSFGAQTSYNSRSWNFTIKGVYVGDNYRSDLGFIRRTDMFKLFPQVQRLFWPKKGSINSHSISFSPVFFWRPTLDFEKSDHTFITTYEAEFNNTAKLEAKMYNRYTYLYYGFDPTRSDNGVDLPANTDYNYTSVDISYTSDRRKVFSYTLGPSIGSFYNGKKYSFQGMFSWRLQPYFTSSIQINYDNIELPNPYPDEEIWLIGPRVDLTFNKKLFWATFIQYSSQRDNFSINSRLQWRFAPLSDLYVVYNDNYFTDNVFAPRVRSFNVKLTYWLNI